MKDAKTLIKEGDLYLDGVTPTRPYYVLSPIELERFVGFVITQCGNGQVKALQEAEKLLNDWLVDNTEEVFEEQPEIDQARGLLNDLLESLQKGL